MENSKIYIGTSGWSYNGWSGIFYPEDLSKTKWLSYYSEHFDTVEVNSSFYHLPKPQTFGNWAKKTPDNFLFVVKASRYITHIKRLKDCDEPFENLTKSAKELGSKLGSFLFQLPPNMKKDTGRLKDFLKILPDNYKYAFEFRDESWFCSEVYNILDNNRCAIVISSSPGFPYHEKVTGKFCYIRMHGGKQLYSSNYSDDELKKVAEIVKQYQKSGIECYVYFNNDIGGYAVKNAKTLIKLTS